MRSFLWVFFLSFISITLYSADTEETREDTVPDICVLENKVNEEEERIKNHPLFKSQICPRIISGFVTRIKKKGRNIFQVTMIVKKVWKGDDIKQFTFFYERKQRLMQSSDGGDNARHLVHHRTKTLDTSSDSATISIPAHHRARSLGTTVPDVIQLHSEITAYLNHNGTNYHLLVFENR